MIKTVHSTSIAALLWKLVSTPQQISQPLETNSWIERQNKNLYHLVHGISSTSFTFVKCCLPWESYMSWPEQHQCCSLASGTLPWPSDALDALLNPDPSCTPKVQQYGMCQQLTRATKQSSTCRWAWIKHRWQSWTKINHLLTMALWHYGYGYTLCLHYGYGG